LPHPATAESRLLKLYTGGDHEQLQTTCQPGDLILTTLATQTLATQTLDKSRPDKYFDVEYPLPGELTQGEPSIVVRLAGHAGSYAGGVFGIAMLRAEKE
jgi:hypothetical protein